MVQWWFLLRADMGEPGVGSPASARFLMQPTRGLASATAWSLGVLFDP